jgi:hypothetical protein
MVIINHFRVMMGVAEASIIDKRKLVLGVHALSCSWLCCKVCDLFNVENVFAHYCG